VRFLDLEPRFIRSMSSDGTLRMVDRIDDAQGVVFLCPKCFEKNRGPEGTHRIVCWSRSRGVPDHVPPGPGRWRLDGHNLGDLSLNADDPSPDRSVKLSGGCGWHGFITHGVVTSRP
jgi:hypothetical protein